MDKATSGGFVMEPGNLWQRRVKRRYLESAPRIATNGEDVFVCPGDPPVRTPVRSIPWSGSALASSDAWARPEAMDRAGIDRQVVYPTLAWGLLGIPDEGLRADCIKSYNSWCFDLCVASPSRLLPAVLLPPGPHAAKELEKRTSSRTRLQVDTAIVDPGTLESVLPAIREREISVVLVRPGGVTPLQDPARFAEETRALAQPHRGAGVDCVIPRWEGDAVLRLERL
jgi:hypothetical protein